MLVIVTALLFTNVAALWADIIVFMDNSGSIRDYKANLHKQINDTFGIAEELNKSVKFIPIGENEYQIAENYEDAKQVFTFDSSYTFVAEPFKNAIKKGVIKPEDTVIIISDMEPDLTNTPNNWQLLACDYQNIIDWYNTLIDLMKKNVSIHLLLLNAEKITQFNPEELERKKIIEDLKENIKGSNNSEKKYKNYINSLSHESQSSVEAKFSYFKSPQQNQRLISRVVKSLQSVLSDHTFPVKIKGSIALYPMKIKEDIMAIIESIIDPSIIKDFIIKLEIHPDIINLSHPDQKYIKSYLEQNAPAMICTNPVRKAKYIIFNGHCKNQPDNAVHYHFKFLPGTFTGRFFDTMLSNKFTKEQGTISSHVVPKRQQYDIKFVDINDLIHKILNTLNNLQKYQAKDFPLGEKKILITLKTELMKFLIGSRLTAKTTGVSELMMGTEGQDDIKLSNKIKLEDKNDKTKGQCSLWVKRQANSEICLSLMSYKNEYKPKEILIPLGTVTASMLHGRKNDIVFTDKKDIPDNIITQVKMKADEKSFHSRIEILGYDVNHYRIIDDKIRIQKNEQTYNILPGSYRYNVIYDHVHSSCLNIRFKPLHVDICMPNDCKKSDLSAFCIEDKFRDYDNAAKQFEELIQMLGGSSKLPLPSALTTPNPTSQSQIQGGHTKMDTKIALRQLASNELSGTFKDHLIGSPYFFYRLFEYTSKNFNTAKNISIIEIWRRVYYRLYLDDEAQDNVIPNILEPALKILKFTEKGALIPKSDIYLKIMLAKYSKQIQNEYLTPDERYMYKYILKRILFEKLHFEREFLKQLSLTR